MVEGTTRIDSAAVSNEEFAELDIRVGEFKEVWKVWLKILR